MKNTFKAILTGTLIFSLLSVSACGGKIKNNDLPDVSGTVETIKISTDNEKVYEAIVSTNHIDEETESKSIVLPEKLKEDEITGTSEYHVNDDGSITVDKIYVVDPIGIGNITQEKDATSATTTTTAEEDDEEITIDEADAKDADDVEVIETPLPKEKELIATFSTNYSMKEELTNRCYNLELACSESSVIIPNGEDFNWHVIVGNTNYADGYKLANMYSGGKLVQGYGGGVCQVSTTMYGCVRELGLPVIELHHHGLPVDYVDWDNKEDAAVDDIGGFNFIWNNNTGYDIEIKAYTSEIPENDIKSRGLLTVEFYKVIY